MWFWCPNLHVAFSAIIIDRLDATRLVVLFWRKKLGDLFVPRKKKILFPALTYTTNFLKNVYLYKFFAAEHAVPHEVPGSTPAFAGMFFPLIVEIQSNLSVETDAEVVVHCALLIKAIPTKLIANWHAFFQMGIIPRNTLTAFEPVTLPTDASAVSSWIAAVLLAKVSKIKLK